MSCRNLIGAIGLGLALAATVSAAQAFDETKYPDLRGEWHGTGGNKWPTPAPLTAEYQAVFEANLKDQQGGGPGDTPTIACLPPGMPRQMNVYDPMQIVITPEMVHILIEHVPDSRRIYTDGRTWPTAITPTFSGYSIGRWVDADGDGRYDVLEVETRGLKGPRIFDPSGIPLHKDNQTVTKERLFLDKANPNILRDEITTFDHALTRPWTVTRGYTRDRDAVWIEDHCAENNQYVFIRGESYLKSADGSLMSTRKDQPPPDLKNFDQSE